MFKDKLAVIIPTKNRPGELDRLLGEISAQKVQPVQVIIVDGGSISARGAVGKFPNMPINYIKSSASLTMQRNIGLNKIDKEAAFVAFFDDDIMPEGDSLENMMKFWASASPDTGGASFNNISDTYKRPPLLEKIFFVNTDTPGKILPSGFQSKICSLDRTRRVEWLLGGATVWRKKIFNEFMFDEWYSGYARYEDVDFSYRVGKKYKLFVVENAKVRHFNKPEDVKFSFFLGKMQVVNRIYFVKKNTNLSLLLCLWACFGLFVNNLVKGIVNGDKRYRGRAKGNIAGFGEILLKRNFKLQTGK